MWRCGPFPFILLSSLLTGHNLIAGPLSRLQVQACHPFIMSRCRYLFPPLQISLTAETKSEAALRNGLNRFQRLGTVAEAADWWRETFTSIHAGSGRAGSLINIPQLGPLPFQVQSEPITPCRQCVSERQQAPAVPDAPPQHNVKGLQVSLLLLIGLISCGI